MRARREVVVVAATVSLSRLHVQGDTESWPKPPVDFKAKVPFWLGLARTGQAKAELLFRSQREVLANILCHPDKFYLGGFSLD